MTRGTQTQNIVAKFEHVKHEKAGQKLVKSRGQELIGTNFSDHLTLITTRTIGGDFNLVFDPDRLGIAVCQRNWKSADVLKQYTKVPFSSASLTFPRRLLFS